MNKYFAALALVCVSFNPYARAAAPVPVFSSCVKPVWPKEALRNGYQGTVTMSFLITKEGTVRESRVTKSSGYPILDIAAQEGIRSCKFKPGTVDGEPAEAWQQMQYVWTLDAPNPAQLAAELAQARAGAEHGEAPAQHKLGLIHLNGRGVPKDMDEAKKWLLMAADQGLPEAQTSLSQLLLKTGRPEDRTEAIALLGKAAAQDDRNAQLLLGQRYETGDGVTQDYALAAKLYNKAGGAGNQMAKAALARMRKNGHVAPEDSQR